MPRRSLFNQFSQVRGSRDVYDDFTYLNLAETAGRSYMTSTLAVTSGVATATDSSNNFDKDEQNNFVVIDSGPAAGVYTIISGSGSSSVGLSPTPTGTDATASYKRHYYQNLEDDLNYIRTQLNQVVGETNWYDAPDTNLYALSAVANIHSDSQEPSGFVNTTDSAISFDDGTRTLTISGTSYRYYITGTQYDKTGAASIQITDVEGMHYVYYDDATLTHTTTFSSDIIYNKAYIAAIYWDAANDAAIYVGDERHGITMDGQTHAYLHAAFGTQYIDGLGLTDVVADGDGTSNAHAQIGVATGHIRDEDLLFTLGVAAAPASIPVFYKEGASGAWRLSTATAYPAKSFVGGSSLLAWNEWTGSTWQQNEVADGGFVLSHIFATNDADRPFIVVQGQAEYTSVATAREGANNEINDLVLAGLPFAEFVPIGTLIYETDSTYTNAVLARVRTSDAGETYVDWRYSGYSPNPQSVADHANLTGRDTVNQHPASAISADTSTFSGTLGSGDTDVQTALESLEQAIVGQDEFIELSDTPSTYSGTRIYFAGTSSVVDDPDLTYDPDTDTFATTDINNSYIYADNNDGTSFTLFGLLDMLTGVRGEATQGNAAGYSTGVFGSSDGGGDESFGVIGLSDGGTSASYGVSGDATGSPYNIGVRGSVGLYAGFATPPASGSINAAVNGVAGTGGGTDLSVLTGGQFIAQGNTAGGSTDTVYGVYISAAGGTDNTWGLYVADADSYVRNLEVNGTLELQTGGVTVNEITTTVTSGSTDDQLPTSKAVYDLFATTDEHNELGGLQGGDTDEYYHLNVHEEAQISATTNSGIALGDTTVLTLDSAGNAFDLTVDSTSIFGMDSDYLWLGAEDTVNSLYWEPSANEFHLYANNYEVISATPTTTDFMAAHSGAERIRMTDDHIVINVNAITMVDLTPTTATIGDDTALTLNGSNGHFDLTVSGGTTVFGMDSDYFWLGPEDTVNSLYWEPAVNEFYLYANNRTILSADPSNGTRLTAATSSADFISVKTDLVSINTGGTTVATITPNEQTFGFSSGSSMKLIRRDYLNDTSPGGQGAIEFYVDKFAGTNELALTLSGTGVKFVNSSVVSNEVLNTADGDSISSSATDSQLASAKLIYNEIASVSGAIDDSMIWETVDTPEDQVRVKVAYQDYALYHNGNVTIGGDLSVSGTTTTINSQELTVADKMITVNYGEAGAGITGDQYAGIEVDRGSETNYMFVFDEVQDNFRVGISGSLQAVATREDTPTDNYVAVWNAAATRFDTEIALTDLATDAEVTVVSGVLQNQIDQNASDISTHNHSHNSLSSIDGGGGGEYNHLSADEYSQFSAPDSSTFNFAVGTALSVGGTFALATGTTVNEVVDSTGSLTAASTDDQLATAKLIYDELQAVTTGSGTVDHSNLTSLDYASSGHTGFAPTIHSHSESDILDLGNYSVVGHTHDERYYTETEIDNLLDGLSSTFIELTDTPSSYTANYIPYVDTTASGLTWGSGLTFDGSVLTAASITTGTGATIDEFSTDTTLSGNSDTAVPTEAAVKAYVDAAITDNVPTYYNVALSRVDSREWNYGSGFTEVPDAVQVYLNGVLQKAGDSEYYSTTISGGALTVTFGFDTYTDDWASVTYGTLATAAEAPSGGGLEDWTIVTTNGTTMTSGGRYMLDSSSSVFTITLPASPSAGDEVTLLDAGASANTNNITVGRNGSNIEGAASDLTIDTDSASFKLVYYNSARGWVIAD